MENDTLYHSGTSEAPSHGPWLPNAFDSAADRRDGTPGLLATLATAGVMAASLVVLWLNQPSVAAGSQQAWLAQTPAMNKSAPGTTQGPQKRAEKTALPALDSMKTALGVTPGERPDPFQPVLPMFDPTTGLFGPDAIPPDPLESIHYSGYIDDAFAKDKVALIKVATTDGTEKTLVKKVGESFVNGEDRFVIRQVSRQQLKLSVNGETRTLDLDPYVDSISVAPSTSVTAPSASSAGNEPASPPSGDKSGGVMMPRGETGAQAGLATPPKLRPKTQFLKGLAD
jgi:hypothetical protein